jgi:hypothetical protein
MNTDQQRVRLIVEPSAPGSAPSAPGASPGPGGPAPAALALPPRPAWLWPRAGGPPQLGEEKPGGAAQAVLLEQVTQRRQPRLLLVREGCGLVHVNGLPAPRFSLLKERDTLRLDGDFLLHVTIYNRPVIGPVAAALIGKECPVCRVPFTVSSRCYVCSCGTALHCEDSGEDCLQCAKLRVRSGCPVCQRPVVLDPGYSYLPEGINEPV